MKTINLIIIGLLISLLGGCAQYAWYHPNKNQNDFNIDKYNCERQAAQMYPVHMAQQQPIYQPDSTNSGSTTNCSRLGDSVNCITTQNPSYNPQAYIPPPQDVNVNNRSSAISSCMQANGWQLRQVNNKPQRQQYSLPTQQSFSSSGPGSPPSINQNTTMSYLTKEESVIRVAEANSCVGQPTISLSNLSSGKREIYTVECLNKTLQVTCEFTGPVTGGILGLPYIGRFPACWIS